MDELAHELLTSDRYCGIALPHLPKRDVLENSGYLDGPRRSALTPLIEEQTGGDAEKFLERLVRNGNAVAKVAWEERRKRKRETEERQAKLQKQAEKDEAREISRHDKDGEEFGRRNSYGRNRDSREHYRDEHYTERDYHHMDRDRRGAENRYIHGGNKSEKKYGSLFKSNKRPDNPKINRENPNVKEQTEEENTEEYWNEQRAKLGLKPLEK